MLNPDTIAAERRRHPLSIERDSLLTRTPPTEHFSMVDFLEFRPTEKKTSHTVMKAVGFIAGAASGVPFYGPAKKFSSNPAISNIMGISTLLSLGSNVIWMTNELLTELLRTPGLIEARRPSLLKKSSRLTISSILGIISLTSQLYLSYQYNNRNIFWPALVLLTTMAYRINGYYQGLKFFEKKCRRKEALSPAEAAAKQKLALQFKNLAKSMIAIRTIQGAEDRLTCLKQQLQILNDRDVIEAKDSCKGYAHRILELIGILALPASLVFINYILTEAALEKVITMPAIISYPLAALMEFPDAVIKIRAGMQLPKTVYDHAYDQCKFPERSSMHITEMPGIFLGMAVLITVISAFSFGSSAVAMAGEVSKDLNRGMLPSLIMANILFHLVGLMTNLGSALDYLLGRSSTRNADAIALRDKCAELSDALETLPFSFYSTVKAGLSIDVTETHEHSATYTA